MKFLFYLRIVFQLFMVLLIRRVLAKDLVVKYGDESSSFRSVNSENGIKEYVYQYVGPQETSKFETGKFDDLQNLQVDGSYSYEDKNGYKYSNTYKAGKDGFSSKVSFGTRIIHIVQNIEHAVSVINREKDKGHTVQKGIDSVLLCSLIGGGC